MTLTAVKPPVKEMMPKKRLLTIREAAEYISVTPNALYKLMYQGQIPTLRLGERRIRFDVNELERWFHKNQVSIPTIPT